MEGHLQDGLPDAGGHGGGHLFGLALVPGARVEIHERRQPGLFRLAGHLQHVHGDDLCHAAGMRHLWHQGLSGRALLQDHVHGRGVSDPYAACHEEPDTGQQDTGQRAVDAVHPALRVPFAAPAGVLHGMDGGAGGISAGRLFLRCVGDDRGNGSRVQFQRFPLRGDMDHSVRGGGLYIQRDPLRRHLPGAVGVQGKALCGHPVLYPHPGGGADAGLPVPQLCHQYRHLSEHKHGHTVPDRPADGGRAVWGDVLHHEQETESGVKMCCPMAEDLIQ